MSPAPTADTPAGGECGATENPFSTSSSRAVSFGARPSFGLGAQQPPLFGLAHAPAAADPAPAAAAPDAAEREMTFDVRYVRPGGGGQLVSLSLPSESATVEGAIEALRAKLPAPSGPLTLLLAGTRLSCPSERLSALGVRSGLSLQCLGAETKPTEPLGRSVAPPPPPPAANASAANASAAIASAAIASAANASASANTSPPAAAAPEQLKLTFLNQRVIELPYSPAMTVMGLKRELERKGEGAAASFRLFCNQRELQDALPLSAPVQKLGPGSRIYITRRDVQRPSGSTGWSLGSGRLSSTGSSGGVAPERRREGSYVGLRNQGATCYLNSLVQALYMTPHFREAMHSLGASPAPLPPLTKAVVGLFASLKHSPSAVSTEALTRALAWGSVSRQQDVHEFWTMLCERIEGEMKGTPHASLIEDIFQGKQRDYVTCGECGSTSHRADHFQDLKLAVPAQPSTPAASVASALRALLSPERMTGDDRYACDCCGRKTDATRGMRLSSLPSVLALQLKRFRYDMRSGQRTKLNTPFEFPDFLDAAQLLSPGGGDGEAAAEAAAEQVGDATPAAQEPPARDAPAPAPTASAPTEADLGGGAHTAAPVPAGLQYELYAVLVHSGSASFGHYYALLKDDEHGEWHEFNDERVKPIKPSELRRQFGSYSTTPSVSSWGGSSAYMLLYRACSTGPKADGPGGAEGGGGGSSDVSWAASLAADTNKRLRLTPSRETPADAAGEAEEDPNPYTSLGF